MKCELCMEKPTFHNHHFDGEEIHLENLSREKRKNYKELEKGNDKIEVCVVCHSKIHNNDTEWNPIKTLYKYRKDIVQERTSIGRKINIFEQYEMDTTVLEEIVETLNEKVEKIEPELKKYVRKHKLWTWLKEIYGIGEVNAGGLIATIGDISDFNTVSDIWSYMGLRPKGSFDFDNNEKWDNYGHYRQATKENRTLVVFHIGRAFVQKGSFYRQFYEERRGKTESDKRFGNLKENKAHYYQDARRYAAKIFLSHVYEVWRRLEELETKEPYILRKEKNSYIEPPHLGGLK